MPTDLNKSVEKLAEPDLWEDALATGAGFMGASIAQTVIDGMTSFDVPNEAYGVLVAVGGQYAPEYSNQVTVGGALYTADALAQRFELKQSITEIGGN